MYFQGCLEATAVYMFMQKVAWDLSDHEGSQFSISAERQEGP